MLPCVFGFRIILTKILENTNHLFCQRQLSARLTSVAGYNPPKYQSPLFPGGIQGNLDLPGFYRLLALAFLEEDFFFGCSCLCLTFKATQITKAISAIIISGRMNLFISLK
jgi:hypothetical protein